MSIESALMILLYIVILFAVAYIAKWVIDSFFPEPIRMPALLIVGVILLIVILLALLPHGRMIFRGALDGGTDRAVTLDG